MARHRTLWFLAGGSAVAEFVLLLAVSLKGGGTTVNPMWFTVLWIPLVVVGVVARFRGTNERTNAASSVLIAASLLGALLPPFLSATGTLVDYEAAMVRGHHLSDHPQVWLSVYSCMSVAVLFGVTRKAARRVNGNA